MDKVHCTTHTLHHLAWDHPICKVAVLCDLHRAKNCNVDVTTANHGKRCCRVEERSAGKNCDGFLSGIYEIRIHSILAWVWSDTKDAVF